MVLYTSPFSSSFLCFLNGLSWGFIFPCYWLLDRLLASFLSTSQEKRRRSQDPCYFLAFCVLVSTPLYLLLLVASLPFALLGFLLWVPLQSARHPYVYSCRRVSEGHMEAADGVCTAGRLAEWRAAGRSFCFSSANVCLLPDSLARFNNLAGTQRRAREVGRRIRNGANRPQIKIYIDSPTNTSISAASFSSLVQQAGGAWRRTSSLDHRPESNGEAELKEAGSGAQGEEAQGIPECPLHPNESQTAPECPLHASGKQGPPECPLHASGQQGPPECPLHASGQQEPSECPLHASGQQGPPECPLHASGQQGPPECPLHASGQQGPPECPIHPSGVQISISAPEPDPEEAESKGNHHAREGDAGSLESCTASRESLTRFHVADSGVSNNTLSHRTSTFRRPTGRKRRHADDGFDHEVSAFFPANLDFLCLQEVFDRRAMAKLRRQLHRYFPFLLSDVGRYGWRGCCSRFKFLNSGLLLASRYPILDAHYQCYPNGRGEDALAAKGALFVKVQVGTSSQGQRVIGYITCTHLHSLEGDASVRCEQLDFLLEWGAEFRKATSGPAQDKGLEDQVAFDVILGDLNFDNCSSEDKLEQQHTLFTHYKDPCRTGPGEDKSWALGTLLDTSGLYDEEVSSPEGLQKVMENEDLRKEYLVYPISKNQCPRQKGQKIPLKGNGRRIDYILYSDEGLQPDWKVDVEEFSFITQLAGLTDHLSVAMRLAVSTGEEEPYA
uniref:Sphingomyelin phosphodiesterase 3 n=1 Tax=Paramormyrops kingsleyae TaxID=1676925 RepID=A0A3B3T476_9TELE|nr:sphingomyelin phosphodiesterase 3 [Paramormyrops kingsleyae]XP_023697409.1 sphingomyelin phosphodiesterase 3 [Paramormyrops kingsleyae]XP_023697410.1 sphingomyelin phosphodiesterase 3 [Paramormyrops kingsleyae]XP_023697412.1 sphingomyelin phosphodiesterase 3 [Paramormyrops kingsleyae]